MKLGCDFSCLIFHELNDENKINFRPRLSIEKFTNCRLTAQSLLKILLFQLRVLIQLH